MAIVFFLDLKQSYQEVDRLSGLVGIKGCWCCFIYGLEYYMMLIKRQAVIGFYLAMLFSTQAFAQCEQVQSPGMLSEVSITEAQSLELAQIMETYLQQVSDRRVCLEDAMNALDVSESDVQSQFEDYQMLLDQTNDQEVADTERYNFLISNNIPNE